MATNAQYNAATSAVLAVVKADVAKEVPAMFQNQIPMQLLVEFSTEAAKAAVDAAEKVGGG